MKTPQEIRQSKNKIIIKSCEEYIDCRLSHTGTTFISIGVLLNLVYNSEAEINCIIPQLIESYKHGGWDVVRTSLYLRFRDSRLPLYRNHTGIVGYFYRLWGYENA